MVIEINPCKIIAPLINEKDVKNKVLCKIIAPIINEKDVKKKKIKKIKTSITYFNTLKISGLETSNYPKRRKKCRNFQNPT